MSTQQSKPRYKLFPQPKHLDADCLDCKGPVKRFREYWRFMGFTLVSMSEDNGYCEGLDSGFLCDWFLN